MKLLYRYICPSASHISLPNFPPAIPPPPYYLSGSPVVTSTSLAFCYLSVPWHLNCNKWCKTHEYFYFSQYVLKCSCFIYTVWKTYTHQILWHILVQVSFLHIYCQINRCKNTFYCLIWICTLNILPVLLFSRVPFYVFAYLVQTYLLYSYVLKYSLYVIHSSPLL